MHYLVGLLPVCLALAFAGPASDLPVSTASDSLDLSTLTLTPSDTTVYWSTDPSDFISSPICMLPLVFLDDHCDEVLRIAPDGRLLVPPDTLLPATPAEVHAALQRWAREQAAHCRAADSLLSPDSPVPGRERL